MPAVKTVPYARWPASESRQRTNPRVMWAEGAAYSAMGIWVMRKVGATDRMRSSGSNDTPDGRQKLVLMVEVAIEHGHRRFTLRLGRRI
jgi:hypothetical protein